MSDRAKTPEEMAEITRHNLESDIDRKSVV